MKSKILGLLAVGLLTAPTVARAVMVTELFQITLPSARGVYSAGHVFEITVTYDDAGRVMHEWLDGPNGIAELGNGDDTVAWTYDLSAYEEWSEEGEGTYTLFSDAQVSISGFAALPTGWTPLNVYDVNRSWYQTYDDPSPNSVYIVSVQMDGLHLEIWQSGLWNNFGSYFRVTQWYGSASGDVLYLDLVATGVNLISRSVVPEPGTLALLGLGLAGLGLSRRRKAN